MTDVFSASFTVAGDTVGKKIPGIFQAVNEDTPAIVKLISDNNNLPVAVSGVIKNENSISNLPVPNVRVSFIKDYIVPEKSNKEYHGNKTVIDWCLTDNNGKYVVFVEPGIYTIRVDSGGEVNYYTNQKIEKGLNSQYFYTVDALIKSRCEDTISFYGTDKRLVSGIVIDEFGKAIEEAEIVITQGENVVMYIKTDSNGRYSFALENGIYDIRIRASNQSVNIIKNFEFKDGIGFFDNYKTTTLEVI